MKENDLFVNGVYKYAGIESCLTSMALLSFSLLTRISSVISSKSSRV